jgi:hypothetical protein
MPDVVKSAETQMERLYALPLAEFVPARRALARTLKGPEARQVKALVKPTSIPWTVNQIYWHESPLYSRLLKLGTSLRSAQVAALEGRTARVQDMSTAHKGTLAEATAAGVKRAAAAGIKVDPNALLRMLETVSLAERLPEPHGRFTRVVEPAGLEALRGVAVKAAPLTPPGAARLRAVSKKAVPADTADARRERHVERQQAAAAKRRARAIAQAEARLQVARHREAEAREAWHIARNAVDAAERDLFAARRVEDKTRVES